VLRRRERRSAWVLAGLLFVSYSYFYQAGGWNQNSRFAMVRAILEHHTLRIDEYHEHTGDRALWQGHYYSDKPPGSSMTALLPVAAARVAARLAGVDPASGSGIAWTSYVATVATSGLFTVAAALAVFQLALRWHGSTNAALFAATAYGLATPAWCYATLFMGHAMTAGCLMIGFGSAVSLSDKPVRGRAAWIVGLATGWAIVTEFQAAVPAALVCALAVYGPSETGWSERFATLARIAAGGMIAASVLFVCNAAAFGSPFHLGYSSEEGFEQLRSGLFGITYPKWWRVREILVGSYRGLLPLSPLIAVTPIGLALLVRQPHERRAVLVAVTIAVYYLLLNASYFYWEGGWAYGPRHVMPALPFVALGLAPLWDRANVLTKSALMAGWVWGAALTLVAVSTTPQPPADFKKPMTELLWPAFRDGDLSLNHQSFVHFRADPGNLRGGRIPHAAWNAGEIVHLHGYASLWPLATLWVIAAACFLLR
jgi:hypothetical protein